MCLFVGVHGGNPLDVKAQARGIIGQHHAKAPEAFENLDRQRTDLELVRSGSQPARQAEVVLLALVPHSGESVLYVLVGILADTTAKDGFLASYIIEADIDAFGPGR